MTYTKRVGILYLICFAVLLFICARTSALAQDSVDSKTDLGTGLKDYSQLNDDSKNNILAAVGLPRASDFGMAKIVAYTIFGAIGFVAFVYGKKNSFWKPMIIGVALMVYPYFISGTFFLYLVGITLSAALYFWRE